MVEHADRREADTARLRELLRQLLHSCGSPGISVRLWDGSEVSHDSRCGGGCVIALRHPRALLDLLWRPSSLSAGEAYVRGDLDVEGDLETAIREAERMQQSHLTWPARLQLVPPLLSALRAIKREDRRGHLEGAQLVGPPASRSRSRHAIAYHYDLPVEFWETWLDAYLQYTCAYYRSEADDVETAQRNKMNYICRKLQLRPGERLLDIGCGWGGLLIWAARRFGARATGVTLSERQAAYARARVAQEGLSGQVAVELCDFRDYAATEPYDKVCGVGIIEHLGWERQAEYLRLAWRVLRPGGLFLNHGMSCSATAGITTGPSFLRNYVFPDACLTPISHTIEMAERCGFELRDVENLREHYSKTLQHWLGRIEENAELVRGTADERTRRLFRLYLSGFAHQFSQARIGLYQTLLAKPLLGTPAVPMTRAGLYEPDTTV